MNRDVAWTTLLSRIEDAGLNASAPPQQRWIDGWMARFSPGKAQRARCINAVANGRMALDEKLAVCQSLYRRAGLPMVVRITPFSQPATLDEDLATRGYGLLDDTRVMMCPEIDAAHGEDLPREFVISTVSTEAYAHIIGGLRETAVESIRAHAQRLSCSPVACQGFLLTDAAGLAVACAQFAVEDDFVGLYDVFTAARHRGKGLSTRLCSYLLRQAAQQGATVAYLQVDAANHAARAVYASLGFKDAYSYHYRLLP